MLYLIAFLLGLSVLTLVQLVLDSAPVRSRAVSRRLAELEHLDTDIGFSATPRRTKRQEKEQFQAVVRELGRWMESQKSDTERSGMRQRLVQAGYRSASAVPIFLALRLLLPVGLSGAAFLVLPMLGTAPNLALMVAAVGGIGGWIGPSFFLDKRIRARKYEIQSTLPDAVDLLVVCVEAGLGLNQAIVRVAEEIRFLSRVLSEEFLQTDLEIRAGAPREEAFRNLAERTQIKDLRSFVTMMIQTDRLGTSIAQALRVYSDTMRSKRQQRAEEAAAKIPVKLLLPLGILVFPTIFSVLLGPAAIQIMKMFAGM